MTKTHVAFGMSPERTVPHRVTVAPHYAERLCTAPRHYMCLPGMTPGAAARRCHTETGEVPHGAATRRDTGIYGDTTRSGHTELKLRTIQRPGTTREYHTKVPHGDALVGLCATRRYPGGAMYHTEMRPRSNTEILHRSWVKR